MTKKDYTKLAAALKDSFPDGKFAAGPDALKVWTRTLNNITRILIDDNPRFSLSRFETACGIQDADSAN